MVKPSGKKIIVNYLLNKYESSIKLTCATINLHRSQWYYHSKRDDSEVIKKLNDYAENLPTYGFDEYYWRIRKEGLKWNRKRVLRVYRNMKLGLRRKRKRPILGRKCTPLEQQTQPNEVWSIDFMSDSLTDGRRIRVFNVLDDYNREALMTKVGISFPAQRVTRLLNQLVEERGKPKYIRCDNGTEFTANNFKGWTDYHNIEVIFIQPGKPTQNAYVERFNKSFRKGVLNAYLFTTIKQAQEKADTWTYDYNYYHPHKSLGRKTPRELYDDFVNSGKLFEFTTINKANNSNNSIYLSNLELS